MTLTLSYLGESKKLLSENALHLLIVRKPPEQIPSGFIHVPQLSPSDALYIQARQWHKEFQTKEEWWDMYEERFLKEIQERKDLIRALDRLEERLKKGEKINLYCYCKDVDFCHRKFIGEEMVKRGFKVDFRKLIKQEQLSLFDLFLI